MPALRVRDLMTSAVETVKPDDPLKTAQDLMSERSFRHVPVADEDGRLVGLVSERDMLRRALSTESEIPLTMREDLLQVVRVGDIMTEDIETVEAEDDLQAAAQTMFENKYGCLPVVDEGFVVGILTEADFVRHVADTGK